jgi:hypothetical protein
MAADSQLGRPEESQAFREQQEWQARAYEAGAIAMAYWLDRRGNLHQQIQQLTLADFVGMLYEGIGAYAELSEKRRAELAEKGEEDLTDWTRG